MENKNISKLTKEELEDLYINRAMSLKSIADLFGVHLTTVYNKLNKFGIERRSCGNKIKLNISREALLDMYINQESSFSEIASVFECSERSIRRLVDGFGIPRRNSAGDVLTYDFLKICLGSGFTLAQISAECGFSIPTIYKYLYKFGFPTARSPRRKLDKNVEGEVCRLYESGYTTPFLASKFDVSVMVITTILKSNLVEYRGSNDTRRKVPDINILKHHYFDEKLSLGEIANIYSCNTNAVYNQFVKNGVELRSKSEALSGENNGMCGKHHSDEACSRMSDAYSQGIREVPPKFIQTSMDTPLQGKVLTRSSWEAAVIQYFNSLGIIFEYEPKRFELEINGKRTSYLPDFFIPAENKYIEVKGWQKADAIEKFLAFTALGHRAEWWGRDKLIELEIIDSSGKIKI